MLRIAVGSLSVWLCACAPGPASMRAAEASEILARFAAGALSGEACAPRGRAVLRGAVRAYGAAMAQAGQSWPALPRSNAEAWRTLDVAVATAAAAGLVEASDLSAEARAALDAAPFRDSAALARVRDGAHLACAEAFDLQHAAARLVIETARYNEALSQAMAGDLSVRAAERLRRQAQLRARAQAHVHLQQAEMDAAIQRRS